MGTGFLENQYKLDGAVAVVTGGSSGIGLATVRAFQGVGVAVSVLDREAPPAPGLDEFHSVDVSDPVVVSEAIDAVRRRHGRLDVLVNCAGMAIRQPALDAPVEDWNRVVAVNMTGTFLCAREAARAMIASGRGGSIVNVASIMGLSGGGLYPNISYQTTKGAVVNMTRALAVEWAPHGIWVNAVAPTYVRTRFIATLLDQPELMRKIEEMTPLRRLAEPEDVASAILYLSSAASAMVTGHTLPVDGGFLAQ
jgi:NAD(P)-dependent dehydrogenase (short-subunit alcohol dehydrogenase family)